MARKSGSGLGFLLVTVAAAGVGYAILSGKSLNDLTGWIKPAAAAVTPAASPLSHTPKAPPSTEEMRKLGYDVPAWERLWTVEPDKAEEWTGPKLKAERYSPATRQTTQVWQMDPRGPRSLPEWVAAPTMRETTVGPGGHAIHIYWQDTRL